MEIYGKAGWQDSSQLRNLNKGKIIPKTIDLWHLYCLVVGKGEKSQMPSTHLETFTINRGPLLYSHPHFLFCSSHLFQIQGAEGGALVVVAGVLMARANYNNASSVCSS